MHAWNFFKDRETTPIQAGQVDRRTPMRWSTTMSACCSLLPICFCDLTIKLVSEERLKHQMGAGRVDKYHTRRGER